MSDTEQQQDQVAQRSDGALGADFGTEVLGSFMLPALLGNIIGGVSLVAALNHAQVIAGEQ